eukprot:tig00001286_g8024.t1
MPRSPESVQRNVEYMRRYRSTPRALALVVVYTCRAKPGTLAKVAERAERAALRRLVNLARGGPRASPSRSRALFAHHMYRIRLDDAWRMPDPGPARGPPGAEGEPLRGWAASGV